MTHKKSALSRKVLTTTGAFLLAGTHSLYAHPEDAEDHEAYEELEETTILASRFDNLTRDTTSSVSSITGEDLKDQQFTLLSDSLNLIPGVQSNAFGPTGTIPSLLTRGLPTGFTQVVVDGVNISNSSNSVANFLTAAGNTQISRLEFLRGPQSVLYGGDAVGGVLGYETKVGGENKISLFGEAGSFESYKTSVSASGTIGKLEYGIEIGEQFTNNDPSEEVSLEDYTLQSGTLGLKFNATDDLNFKFTYRGSESEFETNFGSTVTETDLFTLNTNFVVNDIWTTKLTLGRYEESSTSSFLNSFFDKNSLNWSNEILLSPTFKTVAGYEYSDTEFNNSNGSDVDFHTNGFYLNNYWTPTDALLIEAGVRIEDHSQFDSETSWNVGFAYDFADTGTRISSRISESFRTPTTLDTEFFNGGFSSDQIANPNLETETAIAYEIGIEQEITEDHVIKITYFHQELDDAIFTQNLVAPVFQFSPFFGVTTRGQNQQQNASGESTVSGLEIEARGSFIEDKLNYRLAWTIQDREEVIDIPDHLVSVDINYDGDTWLVGLSANYVDGASYQNPANNADPLDDRIVTRLYGHYEINKHVKLHARIENLFNENYEISPFGDQGPGNERGYFAGVTISW